MSVLPSGTVKSSYVLGEINSIIIPIALVIKENSKIFTIVNGV